MNPHPIFWTLALLLLIAVAGGCELFDSESGTVVVTGRVVLAGTSEPIIGLGVSLKEYYIVRAATQTTADGSFSITFNHGDINNPFVLVVNDEPYDSRYSTYTASIRQGTERDLGVIELEESPAP